MSSPVPLPFSTENERWIAVVARDVRAEDAFVYVMSSSRIFCRPTCTARRPVRRQIRFFSTREEAVAAGYRACRRCKPDAESLLRQHQLLIQQACQLLEQTEGPVSLEFIARRVGLSRFYFHRLFKRYVGVTPKEYSASCQFKRLEALLERGTSIIDAIYDSGFSSTSRIYEKTDKELGMTPAKFKSGGSGLHIYHATVESPDSHLLVALTERGTCMIEFGDTPSELIERLMARFPGAKFAGPHPRLTAVLPRIIELIEGPRSDLQLLDSLQRTAIQRKVRKILQDSWPPREGSGRSPSLRVPMPTRGSPTHSQSTDGASHDDRHS
ncbi:bifunctional transcriptional activator/DNA repair enzyme AdaA [Corallococcus sp. Z5C101001]|uniref:bifunctional transcriptional activator/DNA repair enzyme AdaA n=1 Tax=Corallococcus sp. Z5C101001 TaxID=2596829 RepID=UPI0021021BA6|nr:Ada metal-binding domain-containing protein [Corallococcus sp. Z5C101001]